MARKVLGFVEPRSLSWTLFVGRNASGEDNAGKTRGPSQLQPGNECSLAPHIAEKGQVAGRWPQKQAATGSGRIGDIALFNAKGSPRPPFSSQAGSSETLPSLTLRGPEEIGPPDS